MKNFKRRSATFLVLLLLITSVSPTFAANTARQYKEDIFTYTVENGSVTIVNVDDVREKVVIPSEIDGKPVVALGDGACGGSTTMAEIEIPDSIKSIGSLCFAYCTELTSVKLPQGLKTISNGLFSHCGKLRTIKLPDEITAIENDAFYLCEELWTITIPNSVKTIGENAFSACGNLSAATIPSSVTSIASEAFQAANGFRIYAKPDTKAHEFATKNNITFEELISVTVNGQEIKFDQPPITDKAVYRTLVPMRAVLEVLGAEISWDNEQNVAGIDVLGNRLLIKIGQPFMMVNNNAYELSSPAVEFNLRTLLPIRNVIEAIDGNVIWNENEKHINILFNK